MEIQAHVYFFSLIQAAEKQLFITAEEKRSQSSVLLASYPGVCFYRMIIHGLNLDHTHHSLFDFPPHFEIFWVDVFIQLCWLLGALLRKGFNGVSPSRYVEDGLCWTYIWTKQQGLQSSHPLLVSEDTHRVLECNAVWLVTLEKYCRRTNSHLSWKLNQSLQADEILLKRCNMSCWLWRILLCLHCQHLFWQHYNACFHWLSISKQKALLNPHLLQYLQEWWSVYLLLLGVFFWHSRAHLAN